MSWESLIEIATSGSSLKQEVLRVYLLIPGLQMSGPGFPGGAALFLAVKLFVDACMFRRGCRCWHWRLPPPTFGIWTSATGRAPATAPPAITTSPATPPASAPIAELRVQSKRNNPAPPNHHELPPQKTLRSLMVLQNPEVGGDRSHAREPSGVGNKRLHLGQIGRASCRE